MVVGVLCVVARVLCGHYGVVNGCNVSVGVLWVVARGVMWSLRCCECLYCGWLPGCYVVVKVLWVVARLFCGR